MKIYHLLLLFVLPCCLLSCGGGGSVNVKETQKPTMLVLPSDQLLRQFGCLNEQESANQRLIEAEGFVKLATDSAIFMAQVNDNQEMSDYCVELCP